MSNVMGRLVKKILGEMGFNMGGGPVNWFPGHMASATRAIRDRLKLADLVIEVRDARIPLSSVNGDLQTVLSSKRQVIALNKKDLANPNIMHFSQQWTGYFESLKQDCMTINAHSQNSVKKKLKRAAVGPLPGVTQDIAGFKIIYVLDTPGILVPSIPDIETGLKLALTRSVKDSVVGEERITQYLLAILNIRSTPLHWKNLNSRHLKAFLCGANGKEYKPKKGLQQNAVDMHYIEDVVSEVQCALYITLSEFDGNLEDESALQKAFNIPAHKASDDARRMVSKKFLALFRMGKLGRFTFDDVPCDINPSSN
ncbi:hypothetical protein MKX01_013572 [Papaver californicum]|nr:hypothetical protein MKX01_013572 [Papaver californicum]